MNENSIEWAKAGVSVLKAIHETQKYQAPERLQISAQMAYTATFGETQYKCRHEVAPKAVSLCSGRERGRGIRWRKRVPVGKNTRAEHKIRKGATKRKRGKGGQKKQGTGVS